LQPDTRRIVLSAARAQTVHDLTQAIVAGLARPSVVLARLWVAGEGASLRLAASAGFPTGGGTYSRVDGDFGRVSTGSGKIGRIAHSRTPFIVRSIRGDEEWLANPGWISRQAVRAFAGYPLLEGTELVGVLAVFDRTPPTDAALDDLQFVADYAAARLARLLACEAAPPLRAQAAHIAPVAPLASASARGASLASFGETSPKRPSPGWGREGGPILTRAELREMEKQTIEAALLRTGGKVFGPNGAAALLGMRPTTLASRIKALGLRSHAS
jgi:transcriptional regulator with GAF, ATPase, and Fis domain